MPAPACLGVAGGGGRSRGPAPRCVVVCEVFVVLTRVDHIDLKVPDLSVALAFFATLGFVEVNRTPARGSVEVALPGPAQVVFELREDATLDAFVIDHLAFSSTDQAADVQTLEAAGHAFSRANTFIPVTGKTISDFTDPYGMRWQLTD